ncbi:hypothetical protein [Kurthia sibirica]|uniref:Uncharacterized protein n=1 Tax=Kurthia sibirica TaxID=202750 RepID=A0A2U3AKP5_9BACL|nr:hypothetical protein [Kurthia sibirica]PWI25095.1 hypothetical protein DEX24_10145 [Kurthia sibirica]GEK34015.1 hypothetical protein KSI01_15480 [Kurthia sibirica]
MDDSLHFFVISTSAGYFAPQGFVENIDEATAYICENRAKNAALTIEGTVLLQTISFEELEQQQAQFPLEFSSLYSAEEQAAIHDVCSQLQIV